MYLSICKKNDLYEKNKLLFMFPEMFFVTANQSDICPVDLKHYPKSDFREGLAIDNNRALRYKAFKLTFV